MAEKHFIEQQKHTRSYLIPYFELHLADFKDLRILEVGCAEAGFLDVLHNLGIDAKGIELVAHRIELAKEKNPDLDLIVGDITDPGILNITGQPFDLVVMRDVIEHIPDRYAVLKHISLLLRPGGYLFVSFPPRFSAFAGHQQNGKSWLRKIPFLQVLPVSLIQSLGHLAHEREEMIREIIRNKHYGLPIRAFEKIAMKTGFNPVVKEHFIFRPIYQTRFNLKPWKIPAVPLIREVVTMGYESLLQLQKPAL